jgi:Tfp pilus assembly PilM family ATPase
MARKEPSILGIDLHEQEIRVVQVNVRSNRPTLGKIGRAPMPEGAVMNGRVLHPGPVAVALRLLLNSMGIGPTARAVIGVLGDGTTLRTMSVPPVPDHELPTIIAGEVNHYGLVRTAGGAYSFLRLNPHNRTTPAERATQDSGDKRETWLDPEAGDQNPAVVTVVAVEEEILTSLRETIEQANLTIEAIEPTQYGMFRTIMSTAGAGATLFALMVSPANTDVAFVHKGLIVGYRRIDIGSRLLALEYTTNADAPGSPGPVALGVDAFGNTHPPSQGERSGSLNRLAVESLSLEVQRTLNYYQREFPAAAIEDHVFLAIDDARIDDVARELTLSLGVSVEAIRPALNAQDSPDSADTGAALSSIYAAAFGLAVHGQPIMGRVPRIDLFTKQRAGVQQAETQRNFRGSVITSLLAIALGTIGYFLYHKQIADLQVATNDTTARTMQIKGKTSDALMQRRKQEDQYKALREEGVPVTEILDYLANSFRPGSGLDSILIQPDLSIAIQGESINEELMIDTYQTLQRCPVMTNMRIVKFAKLPPEMGVGVGFEVDGKAVSVGRIRLAEEKKPPAIVPAPNSKAAPGIKLVPEVKSEVKALPGEKKK